MAEREAYLYPFSAIVGQERMKKALLLNAVNPLLGGVLIRGHKGTAKSTAARGLARLLPEIEVVEGCPFNCDPSVPKLLCPECRERAGRGEELPRARRQTPFVDLPLGATEDRVIGTLNIEHAIKKGERLFEPGLLAAANRGIVYVDEVNLLDDHLVDILLDAAAMGVNVVEREGVSFSHAARFILIGSMNPEEGELRPQLLDRFGLCVEIEGVGDPAARAEIVRMRLAFEADPEGFAREWESVDGDLSSRIAPAQALLDRVRCPEDMLEFVARVALDMGVHGHRADISMVKTARTIAAFGGREEVTKEDIREAAELVLPHRMRRSPFEEPSVQEDRLDEAFEKHSEQKETPPDPFDEADREDRDESAPPVGLQRAPQQDFVFGVGNPYHVKNVAPRGRTARGARGRRGKAVGDSRAGRYVRSAVPKGEIADTDIALDATLRAAAPHQPGRRSEDKAFVIEESDFRQKIRERRVGSTVVFVVDSSGSMGARQRMVASKGAILSLLVDAYQRRDKVAMVAFKADRAEVLLPPTASVELAKRKLEELPTGGKTPFSRGLCLGYEVLAAELLKDKNVDPLLVLVSDGRANVALAPGRDAAEEVQEIAEKLKACGIRSVAIDTESGPVRFGNMARFAESLGAACYRMEDIKSDRITDVVRDSLAR